MNDIKSIIYIITACFVCFFVMESRHAPQWIVDDVHAMSSQIEQWDVRAYIRKWQDKKMEFELKHGDNPLGWAPAQQSEYMTIVETLRDFESQLEQMEKKEKEGGE